MNKKEVLEWIDKEIELNKKTMDLHRVEELKKTKEIIIETC